MNKKDRLKCIMPMTGNNNSTDKVEAADNIINSSIFILRDLYDIHIDVKNGWLTESDSRILRRRMHTHVFLSDFTRAYAETNDDVYFTESFKLLEDWFARYPAARRNEIEELAYHPEGTAIRLLFWFKYYNQFYNHFNDRQMEIFDNNIDENATLLNQDDFYAGMTNHGMFQNMGLLAYAIFKEENFSTSDIFNKAISRITDYFCEVFTSEGVHKEHSPSYHVLLIHSLKQILQTLEMADYNDEKVDILRSIFNKAANYTTNIVTPDFKLPNISDGTQFNMSTSGVYKTLFNNEEYKFITSAGKEGIEPSPLIKAFPNSGYLIARNSWRRDATYFLFLASYHMHFHKHTDDLSFILHKNGPIFIDAGPYSYDYKNPFTQYAYSQYAHSTLIVNNNSLPRTDHKFESVQITHHRIDDEEKIFVVEGVNERYQATSHTRKISGDLKTDTFSIVDKVISENSNQYKFLFQINGDLDVIKNGNIVSIFKNNAKVAELEVENYSGVNGLKVYAITGQKFPQIMGYQFPKIEKIKHSTTLVIECYNDFSLAEIKTNIRLSDYKIKGNANFNKRTELKHFRDISYIYEYHGYNKLAVIFSAAEGEYNYKLDEFTELQEKGFNLLYLLDNQHKVGRSFLQGESSSTIEADVLNVLNTIINENNIIPENVYLFGRSKGGFAALYYALTSAYKNVFISTPLILIGDYYARHEKFEPIIKDLGLNSDEQLKYYLNDYLSNINVKQLNNINICVGENDYNKKKHVDYLTEWLDAKKISYHLHIYPGAEFKNDKKEFTKFIENYDFN